MIFYTNMQLIPKITFKYFCLEEKQNKWIVGQFVKIKLRDSFLCVLLLHLKWIPIIPTFKKWSSTCSYPKTSEIYKTQKRTLGSNNFYRLSLLFSQTTKVDSNLVRMIHALSECESCIFERVTLYINVTHSMLLHTFLDDAK